MELLPSLDSRPRTRCRLIWKILPPDAPRVVVSNPEYIPRLACRGRQSQRSPFTAGAADALLPVEPFPADTASLREIALPHGEWMAAVTANGLHQRAVWESTDMRGERARSHLPRGIRIATWHAQIAAGRSSVALWRRYIATGRESEALPGSRVNISCGTRHRTNHRPHRSGITCRTVRLAGRSPVRNSSV